MIVGIALFGVLTATVAAYFVEHDGGHPIPRLPALGRPPVKRRSYSGSPICLELQFFGCLTGEVSRLGGGAEALPTPLPPCLTGPLPVSVT